MPPQAHVHTKAPCANSPESMGRLTSSQMPEAFHAPLLQKGSTVQTSGGVQGAAYHTPLTKCTCGDITQTHTNTHALWPQVFPHMTDKPLSYSSRGAVTNRRSTGGHPYLLFSLGRHGANTAQQASGVLNDLLQGTCGVTTAAADHSLISCSQGGHSCQAALTQLADGASIRSIHTGPCGRSSM